MSTYRKKLSSSSEAKITAVHAQKTSSRARGQCRSPASPGRMMRTDGQDWHLRVTGSKCSPALCDVYNPLQSVWRELARRRQFHQKSPSIQLRGQRTVGSPKWTHLPSPGGVFQLAQLSQAAHGIKFMSSSLDPALWPRAVERWGLHLGVQSKGLDLPLASVGVKNKEEKAEGTSESSSQLLGLQLPCSTESSD